MVHPSIEVPNIVTLTLILLSLNLSAQTPEQKLNKLGIQLPQIPETLGSYVDMVRVGDLVFLRGKDRLKQMENILLGK